MPKPHPLTQDQIETFYAALEGRTQPEPFCLVKTFDGFTKDPPWFLFRDPLGHMSAIHLAPQSSGAVRCSVNHYDLGVTNREAFDGFVSLMGCLSVAERNREATAAHLELTVLPEELEDFAGWVLEFVEAVCNPDGPVFPPGPRPIFAGGGRDRNLGLPDYVQSRAAWALSLDASDAVHLALPRWADAKFSDNCH